MAAGNGFRLGMVSRIGNNAEVLGAAIADIEETRGVDRSVWASRRRDCIIGGIAEGDTDRVVSLDVVECILRIRSDPHAVDDQAVKMVSRAGSNAEMPA